MTLIVAHTALCTALFWGCFCRLTHINQNTKLGVRAGIWSMAAASLAMAAAPWVWEVQVNWFSAALAGSVLLLQLGTSTMWKAGVPAHLQSR